MRAEDIRSNRAREVSDSYLQSQSGAAFILASKIIPEPLASEPSISMEIETYTEVSEANQVTIPGKAAYVPATQKNVPKYFTPIGALDMLMLKPMRLMTFPSKMKGDRSFVLSEK